MTDSGHFHNLTRGGIPRQLAEGLSARVFPGEHLMLSVVEIAPGSVSPPNVPHGGRALPDKRAVVLDIFSPPREEYKKAGSGYK